MMVSKLNKEQIILLNDKRIKAYRKSLQKERGKIAGSFYCCECMCEYDPETYSTPKLINEHTELGYHLRLVNKEMRKRGLLKTPIPTGYVFGTYHEVVYVLKITHGPLA